MIKIYKIVLLFFALGFMHEAFSQKVIRYRITNVNTNYNSDCDGIANSSDFSFWFTGAPNGTQCDGSAGDDGPINRNPNFDLAGGTYYSRECVPTGTFQYTFRPEEDDDATFDNDVCNNVSGACTDGPKTRTYPAWNEVNGNTTINNNAGISCNAGCDAPFAGNPAPQNAAIIYRYTSQWQVSGSYPAGVNVSAVDGYLTNKTCATAIDIDGGTEATGLRVSGHVNQCNDIWYVYDVTSVNLTNLTFSGATGTVTVFYDQTASCNTSCTVASGAGGVSLAGPVSTGRYYIRISSGGSTTNLSVSKSTGTFSNDFIAAASNLGVMPGGGGALQILNTDNFGTTMEVGEPGLADNHTDWFYFTTGATVPAYVDIEVRGNAGATDLDADFRLWRKNDLSYTFPRYCVNWSKLTDLGDGDGDDNAPCRIGFSSTLNSYRRYCLDPNQTYYIQVAGWRNDDVFPCNYNEWEGNYDVVVTGPTTAKGRDNVCEAHDFGTLNPNVTTPDVYYNNSCLTTESGEQRTGDMSHTMWYKFRTPPAGLTGVNILVEEAGEGANYTASTLYRKTGACSGTSGLTEVAFERWCGSDGGTFSIECLDGNTDYYLQVGTGYNFSACTNLLNGGRSTGRYRVRINTYNAVNGVDNVCLVGASGETVGDLGTFANYAGSNLTFTRTNHSNECATTQANEPGGGQKTTWYSFTTNNVVGRELYVEVDAKTNGMDAEVYIYEACGTVCTGNNLNAGVLNELANYWDGLLVPAFGIGEWDASGTLTGAIKPNTTYYIRVDGVNLYGDIDGTYDLIVRQQGGFYNGNDDICNAWTVGASNSPGGSGAVHTESISNNDILDLGETITVPTFNNKQASAQEQCTLDEPNMNEDDESVWFKVTTGATPGSSITINVNATNGTGGVCVDGVITAGWVKAYKVTNPGLPLPVNCAGWTNTTNWFNRISEAGRDDLLDASIYYIECPAPNTTYYIQVETGGLSTCDMADFTMTVTDNGKTAGPDKICDAIDLGTAPYGGPLSNTTNVDLFINNQTNACATVAPGEPNAYSLQSVDKTVWYKFTTPPAYYPTAHPLAQLPHIYTFEVNRLGGASLAWPTFAIFEQTAATVRTCSPENLANSFQNLVNVDYTQNLDFGDASLEYICLKANTTYYIQVDHATANIVTPGDDYVDFSLRIKKAAFRAADNLCDAIDLGIITSNGLPTGTSTNVNWTNAGKFGGAPYFSLPHTNKCTSSENGENDINNPGPNNVQVNGGGNHTATTWYKFTTGNTVPDWIYWYNDDNVFGNGNRGGACLLGATFNSEVTFLAPEVPASCPVHTQLDVQPEMNIPGDLCEATSGIGFGAPCYKDLFRLKCPRPNTTYYVQIKDAGTFSTCYEGLWTFNNTDYGIKTAPTIGGAPANDSICAAIDLGTVPNGGQLAPATIYDNFCATPDYQWRADFTQPLEADVWFKFKPPLSGSVIITAQSAPAGSPGVDDDLDLQVSIWEPILGNANRDGCNDPRYLWTPIISQDHAIQEATEAGVITTSYYNIYETCGNSVLCNEGNSLVATCLDPNKYYFIQVDGGDYFGCDLIDAGDCVMGYFKVQVKDANLGLFNSANLAQNISPYTAPGVRNFQYLHDEPCFAQALPVNAASTGYGALSWVTMTNRCATSINDPIPSQWQAKNASTDKTVWASFVAPPSGKVKIRAENINQVKGNDDYHEAINLQLAVYYTPNCFDKWNLVEIDNGNGFDGGGVEIDPLNEDDYVSVCVPCVGQCGYDEYMVSRCLIPGQTYYVMIDGDAGHVCGADVEDVEGEFRISVQELNGVPASVNDEICDAYDMEVGVIKPSTLAVNASYTTPIAFNNECATINPNYEGSGKIAEEIEGMLFSFDVEHTLWFKFRAPSSGKVKIEAIQDGTDDIDLGLAIFDIPSQNCTHIQSQGFKFDDDYDPAVLGIADSDDEEITVSCLTPNKWYWIQVDGNRNLTTCGPLFSGTDCETGQFKVKITHLPSDPTYADIVDYTPNPDLTGGNDNYCQAHRIRSASGTINIFNNATYLQNAETITFRHNNRCATTEVNEPELNGWDLNPFNSDNTPTVWYAFNTGPILPGLLPGEITINITNPSGSCFDPDMDLYEYTGPLNSYYTAAGCTNLGNNKFDRLFRVGEGSNIPYLPLNPRNERITLTCPKPMTTYLLRVAGSSTCPLFGDNMGDFDLSISMSPTPGLDVANDDICQARNMGTLSAGGTLIRNLENNFCATQQQGEPNTDQGCVQSEPCSDETVWFKFRTSATPGDIEIVIKDILSLGYIAAPIITVYKYTGADNSCSANPFNGLGQIDQNSGVVVIGGVQVDSAKVSIPCARPNTWYYIQVDGIDMALLGFPLPGSTDNFIFNLQVRDLGNFSKRASNDNLANALPMDSNIVAPNPYILPSGGTISRKGHNVCATCENNEEGDYCGVDETGHTASFNAEDETVWYYFTTPSKPGVTTITVADDPASPGTFSPNFRLYYYNTTMGSPQFRTTNAPNTTLVQEGASSSGIGSSTSVSYTCLLPNTRYLIQVDGNDNVPFTIDQGDFIITVADDGSGSPGPSNDLICNAELLSTNMGATVSRTNRCSWEETGEPNTSANMGGTGDDVTSNDYDETVWFTFVPDQEQSVRLTLDVTSGMLGGINYVLYEKTGISTITCSGTPADIPNWSQLKEIAGGSSTLILGNEVDETWPCLKPTNRYYLQVDGNDLIGSNDVGNFNIQLTRTNQSTPLNDNICGIGVAPGVFPSVSTSGNFGAFGAASATLSFNSQNNTCATMEVGEPNTTQSVINDITSSQYDHTLWYKFVASNTDGTYNIAVTNAAGATDVISANIVLYREDGNTCPSANFSSITQIKSAGVANVLNGNNSINLECWEIEEGRTYYIQIQGGDLEPFGDVGNNFSVSVQFTAGATNPADNICTAPLVTLGSLVSADNRCATTQANEPNVSPMPQTPANGRDYDETLWYRFVAPPSGEVRLSLSNFSVPLLLSVNMNLYEAPVGYNCGISGFTGLIPNESSGFLTSGFSTTDFRCLSPGRTYYIQFDGNDGALLIDRGTWDFQITDLYVANTPPANDEPCGAINLTSFIRTQLQGPCTSDGQYYSDNYSVVDLATDIDQATKTATALGCNGELNCNDYWFSFTVPLDATGIRIQGNDEYGFGGFNNSNQNIGIYRAPNGCGGPLQRINCGSGGLTTDPDFTVAAFPGETLYLQVFNSNAPSSPTYSTFGLCLSVDCPPKTACGTTPLSYDGPQCWNMNTSAVDFVPAYYDCLSGSTQSVNYFSFSTSCDNTPVDTVTLVFSVTNLGCGATAMSMYRDNTLCNINGDEQIMVNCAVFEQVAGGTTATNFLQTYILPACNNYVLQIISDENTAGCASSGQILIVQGGSPTTVLPIELLSFTGYNDGSVNVLNWTTSSEVNSLKFEVEKSLDASNFVYIGEKLAAGNSIVEIDYDFIDENPNIGNNYYRLKMIDIDGKFKYSEIINIRVNQDNTPAKDGIVKIFPNPTNGLLNVQYQSSKKTELDLNVFDVTGRNMLNGLRKVEPGMNILQIDAIQFAKGMYILNLLDKDAQENHQAKFIKE